MFTRQFTSESYATILHRMETCCASREHEKSRLTRQTWCIISFFSFGRVQKKKRRKTFSRRVHTRRSTFRRWTLEIYSFARTNRLSSVPTIFFTTHAVIPKLYCTRTSMFPLIVYEIKLYCFCELFKYIKYLSRQNVCKSIRILYFIFLNF